MRAETPKDTRPPTAPTAPTAPAVRQGGLRQQASLTGVEGGRSWPKSSGVHGGLLYGGDYNAEQWDESVWRDDVELMRRASVNIVTVGVFAWSLIEPQQGQYDFSVMDRVLEMLHAAGIAVDLATPTAAPPAWLVHQHPQMRPVTSDGHVLGVGARESFCPSSPAYRAAAASIAGVLARRYGDHAALAMWHVNNEFGAHVGPCYCDVSAAAFRHWLLTRYHTLESLNDAWGTTFWGQAYSDWEQVQPPRRAPMPTNPAQQLDFMRFSCDEYIGCFRNERDTLREITPDIPITTNFMATTCKHMDYWRWVDEVDVVANDHYLIAEDPRNHVELAMAADLTRSLAGGNPWLLMEHSTGAVNWQSRNIAKLPGQLRRNSLAHVARGADGAMFFQWRASRFGAEKFHSAMLPHAGTASRTWQEVCELGSDLEALEEVRGATVQADVAIVWDWPSWWALELEYRPSIDLTFEDRMRAFYSALWDESITVDFVHPERDLSAYALVVVPSLYLTTATAAENLRQYVAAGGTLLVSFFSGIVDENDQIHPGAHPGALRSVLGLSVEEFHPLRASEVAEVGALGSADVWSERIELDSAECYAEFTTGPDAGHPAVTKHRFGDGQAWYVGTRLDRPALTAVLRQVLDDAGVTHGADFPLAVEAVRRTKNEASYLFVINHDVDTSARVPATGVDLLTGRRVDGKIALPPSGVAVIREDSGPLDGPLA